MSKAENDRYNRRRYAEIIFWGVASLACMIVIFYMSHKPAVESSNMSGTIVEWLIAHGIGESIAGSLELIVRKCAHMAEYFGLTLCVTVFLIKLKDGWDLRLGITGVVFSFLYAVSDEVHQLFIEGRAGRPIDVLIDTVGMLLAFIIIIIVKKVRTA